MSKFVHRYDIPLLPAIKLMQEREIQRASNARKNTKVKNIGVAFMSLNNAYPTNPRTGGRYLSPLGEVYKKYIHDTMRDQDPNVPPVFNHDWYECSYVFYMTKDMLFLKDGRTRENSGTDVSNLFKLVEDSLFEYLLGNDCQVISLHGYKRFTVYEPKIVVLISKAELSDGIYNQDGGLLDSYNMESGGEVVQKAV